MFLNGWRNMLCSKLLTTTAIFTERRIHMPFSSVVTACLFIKMILWGRIPSLSHLKKKPALIYFIYGCAESSLLWEVFLWSLGAEAALFCCVPSSHCRGFSCCKAQAVSMWASVVVAYGLNCPTACQIFPEQGSNPCRLDWQADPNHWTAREVQHTHIHTHTLKKKLLGFTWS